MSNIKWKKLLQLTFILLATLTASVFLGIHFTKPNKSYALDLDPKTVNVEFKVGEVSVTANNYDKINNKYSYPNNPNPRVYVSGQLGKNINQNQNYMLKNYDAQNRLAAGQGIEQIKNIYISMGTPYDTVMSFNEQAGEEYGDYGVLLSSLSVTAKVNG